MGWIKVAGRDAPELESWVEEKVKKKTTAGEFSIDNVEYIKKIDLSATKGELAVSGEDLERLRKLCQLWDLDLKVFSIKSHRKIIGPFIVALKKVIFPILRVFLKESMQQQRAFNAEVISYLARISRRGRTL